MNDRRERIGRYIVHTPIKGGGKSQCFRAQAPDGSNIFLKRFLAPMYPVDPGPDPVRTAKVRAKCDEFARRHTDIMELLRPMIHGGGNLVKPLEFFRQGGAYYKAYPFLEAQPSGVMARAKPRDKQIFLKTLLLSVRELHAISVVHADLKPDNVMVKQMSAGLISKLIDFDEAYVAGCPPSVRGISGDPAYYSPELERYADGRAKPTEMTLASDMFSLGLVVHCVFTGELPKVDGGSGDSCARRVESGSTLSLQSMAYLPAEFEHLLVRTLLLDPERRPTIDDLTTAMGLPRMHRPSETPPENGSHGDPHPTSRVVSKMGRHTVRPD